ncbi:MAG: AAA family ATPase [Cyanobacteria bacterium P01_E01_bin.42]
MITEIKLENFKGHQSTQLYLDDSRLHALVGKNSSGKTSVLKALYYFRMLIGNSFSTVFWGESSPDFLIGYTHQEMSVTIQFISDNKQLKYGYYGFKNKPETHHKHQSWEGKISVVEDIQDLLSKTSHPWSEHIYGKLPKVLEYMFYFKLSASNLSKAAYSEDIDPKIQFNGSGLAPTLDYLRNEDIEKFQELQKMLQRIVPNVKKIRIQRAKVEVNHHRSIAIDGREITYDENQERIGQEIVFDMNTGDRIPAHAVSEGTILALGLLTVLMNSNKPQLVLLDDIEQGLHPRAQRELIAIFKEIIQTNPNLQIIFTTHSPYIVDELDFSQVHVLDTNSSGFTTCKRLDEHPDVEWAKQTLTTGEFWNAEGEEWVNEKVPEEGVNV